MSYPEPPVRSRLLVLEEPKAPGAPLGVCRWCGEAIVPAPGAHPMTAYRTLHRGDDRELGDTPDCVRAFNRSRCWSARDALKLIARRDHGGRLVCADCGTLCEQLLEHRPTSPIVPWEADHERPLWDGGEHELSNFRVRCADCHGAKTIREARERANRRRAAAGLPPLDERSLEELGQLTLEGDEADRPAA